jgi:MFS transporter, ACS family, tartrate transporter
MLVCGLISDRVGDRRRWSLSTTCVISTIGLVFAGITVGSWWSLVGIIVSAIGFYGTKGPFWSMSTMF